MAIDPRLRGRLLRLLLVAGLVAAPAIGLRVFCIGHSCQEADQAVAAAVPFCPLPQDVRQLITDGYRVGRSADVFAISKAADVEGSDPDQPTGAASTWPWLDMAAATRVPIVFEGEGLPPSLHIAGSDTPGPGLADVGPTLAELIGFDPSPPTAGSPGWLYPQYRDGHALTPPGHARDPASLALLIAWKGVGSDDLESAPKAWPFLHSVMHQGVGTLDGHTGAIPIDSTPALTSMGTGGLPATHGIVGTMIRNEAGELVQAWSDDAPVSVITTFSDSLDERTAGVARIGMVSNEPYDRGMIGGTWYPGRDDDEVRIVDEGRIARTAEAMLASGYGSDDHTPDVLAVSLDGSVATMDRTTARIVAAAERETNGSVAVAIAGTGSASAGMTPGDRSAVGSSSATLTGKQITDTVNRVARADVVEATVPGALFLDQAAVTAQGISPGTAVEAINGLQPNGVPVMADAFPGYAVSFGRYC